MNAYASKTCEELRDALATATASVESPRMAADANVNDIVSKAGSSDPEATQPDLMKDIEEIKQALREAGCS